MERTLGLTGEDLAVEYLTTGLGWNVIDRNWRCPSGEIDIVADDGTAVVFVEVKTRRSLRAGDPTEAITRTKLKKLHHLGVEWLRAQNAYVPQFRFDAIGVLMCSPPSISHVRDVR